MSLRIGHGLLAAADRGMSKYRFLMVFQKDGSAIGFTADCCDDDHARTLVKGVIFDPKAHAEVWAGSRFVGVVDAKTELGETSMPLPTPEGRASASSATPAAVTWRLIRTAALLGRIP